MIYGGRLLVLIIVLVWAWSFAVREALRVWRARRARAEGREPGTATRAASRRSRADRLVGWLGIGFAVLSVAVTAWSKLEPYHPEVTRITVASPKLQGQRKVRLVQLSDLHSDEEARLEERLPEIVAAEAPDFIVFTGDSINGRAGLEVFQRLMRRLVAIAPVYAVKGNWEAWWQRDIDHYRGTGVVELNGEALAIRVGDEQVWLVGAAVENEHALEKAFAAAPRDRFTILLHHFPMLWRVASEHGADLHLAGDTHGGQVVLPLMGAIVRIARDDRVYYEPGLHRLGSTLLYVSRGIGMEGGHAPRVRFNCRPEVTVIDLVPPHLAAASVDGVNGRD